MLTPEHIDIPMTYEDLAAAGTMLGTGTPMMFDETTSVVKAVTRWLEFYKHESCGKCTPCREGTYWITGMLEKFEHGKGLENELSVINDVCSQIAGRSFCALGDAAATPFPGAMKYFAEEFKQATRVPVDLTFPPTESTVFSKVGAR
jgi:NADH-quinone oxidoreductase subunit F